MRFFKLKLNPFSKSFIFSENYFQQYPDLPCIHVTFCWLFCRNIFVGTHVYSGVFFPARTNVNIVLRYKLPPWCFCSLFSTGEALQNLSVHVSERNRKLHCSAARKPYVVVNFSILKSFNTTVHETSCQSTWEEITLKKKTETTIRLSCCFLTARQL